MQVALILECGIATVISIPNGTLPDVIVRGASAWIYDDINDHGMPLYRSATAYVEPIAGSKFVEPANFDVHFGGIA